MLKITVWTIAIVLFLAGGYLGEFLAKLKFIKSFKAVFVVCAILAISFLILVNLNRWYWYIAAAAAWIFWIFWIHIGFDSKRNPLPQDPETARKTVDTVSKHLGNYMVNASEDAVEELEENINNLSDRQ